MKPVRFYLILLFVAVAGIGLYLIFLQHNEDVDINNSLSNQKVTSNKPAASPTATAKASATPAK